MLLHRTTTVAVALFLFSTQAFAGAAWWNNSWAHREKITVNNVGINSAFTNFPVRVRLTPERFNYANAKSFGEDIRFVDDQGNLLSHEVESWSDVDGSEVWVRLPTVASNSTTTFYVYYGNSSASDVSSASATWNGEADAVWHLQGRTSPDSSGNNRTLTPGPSNTTFPTEVFDPTECVVGNCLRFDGSNDYVSAAHNAAFSYTNSFTISAWVKVDGTWDDTWEGLVTKGDTAWRMHRHDQTNYFGFGITPSTGSNTNFEGTSNGADGNWHYVAVIYTTAAVIVYVDGEQESSTQYNKTIKANTDAVTIGNNAGASGRYFQGWMDEVRLTSVIRSSNRIKAEYRSQSDTYLSFCQDDDNDRDSYSACDAIVDCDDDNANVNPGRTETCDGVDNDCDGSVDEGLTTTYYTDADGDGAGLTNTGAAFCTQPVGTSTVGGDCDDTNAKRKPGLAEECDGIDNDCSNGVPTNETDPDSDGAVECAVTVWLGSGSKIGGDCAPNDPARHPAAIEVCSQGTPVDEDCDALVDLADPSLDVSTTKTVYVDNDSDGFGTGSSFKVCAVAAKQSLANGDCNDAAAAVNPGATEVCNTIDDDCDSLIDDNDTSLNLSTATTRYRDSDGDAYGDPNTSQTTCIAAPSFITNNTDCDDTKASVNPGATEVCNGFDDDCDGSTDDADTSLDLGTTTSWYTDADGDNHGVASNAVQKCAQPDGRASSDDDCDDTSPLGYPGATELCDEKDNDCNTVVDDPGSIQYIDWYRDADFDGFGDDATPPFNDCKPPSQPDSADTVSIAGDCDDTNININPNGNEVYYNDIDEDCDGVASADFDGDGVDGIAPGEIGDGTEDCDDQDATIYPGAPEVPYDQIDQDCDTLDLADVDGDGVDAAQAGGDDCDDTNDLIFPGAEELCDGVDSNCDATLPVDELDSDGDGIIDCADCDPNSAEPCETGDTATDTALPGRGIDTPAKLGEDASGCNCDQLGGSPSLLWLLALGGLAMRRRRAS